MKNRWVTGIFLVGLVGGIGVCLWAIWKGEATPTEALLLTVILTILSVLGSWFVSQYYSEYTFNKNLRTFAFKAAEKVTNLSNELDRLAVYLQQDLDPDEFASPVEALLARDMRIEGAVHLVHTLKSVNDGSLSDWQGVIGDELAAQKEEREEREEEIRDLVDRIESLLPIQSEDTLAEYGQSTAALQSDFDDLKKEVRLLLSQVGGRPVRFSRKASMAREQVELPCPVCAESVEYMQKPKRNSYKAVDCKHCKTRLYSRYEDGNFTLRKREPVIENVLCPSCSERFSERLDPMVGTAKEVACPTCGVNLRIYRTIKGVGVKTISAKSPRRVELDEELLKQVQELMPPQPWPKGASKEVAAKLSVPVNVVSRAVNELIRQGVFMVQIDGKLYVERSAEEHTP
jgi:hypothetical protein